MKICENCGCEHDGTYGSGRFCSRKCARCFSTKGKRSEINDKISKTLKNKLSVYKSKSKTKSTKVISNKKLISKPKNKKKTIVVNKKIIKCKYCNSEIETKHICEDCKPYIQNIILFKKLGVYSEGIKLSICNKFVEKCYFKEVFHESYWYCKKSG